jgi:hypothetical protein
VTFDASIIEKIRKLRAITERRGATEGEALAAEAGQGDLAQLVERLAVIADRLAETADRLTQTAPPIGPLLPTVEAPAHADEHADDREVPSTIEEQ